MLVTQAHTLINLINKEMFGQEAITLNDSRGVIQLGKTVLSSQTNRDQFLGLVDRIALTRLRTLDLEVEFPSLLRLGYDWGSIIQKITIRPFQAKQQNAWNVGKDNFTPSLYDIDKPQVVQKFFTDAAAYEFDVTITDKMLTSAFTSVESFGAFIDGIMKALSDSAVIAFNDLSHQCINNFIAEKAKAGNGVVNILTAFNAQFNKSYTSLTAAYTDPEFQRYFGMTMKNIIGYMSQPSVLYNVDGIERATARDNMHILISNDLWNAYSSYLMADTFWKDLVNLDGFKTFITLQATGTDSVPTIEGNTKINIIPASNASNDNTAVELEGVVAVLADRESMAVGYDDRFSGTDRNNRDRYTNYTEGFTQQWLNDLSENGVIIIANNVSLSVDKTSLTFANSSAATQTVTATTSPAGETVTWTSKDATVATVAAGVVTPVGEGSTTVTASMTYGGLTFKKDIAVTVGSTTKSAKK